ILCVVGGKDNVWPKKLLLQIVDHLDEAAPNVLGLFSLWNEMFDLMPRRLTANGEFKGNAERIDDQKSHGASRRIASDGAMPSLPATAACQAASSFSSSRCRVANIFKAFKV